MAGEQPSVSFRLPERALVMGLGVHGGGLGAARWLLEQGVAVTVTDLAPATALTHSLAALAAVEQATGRTIRYVLGEHRAEDFRSHPLLVVNPAVRPDSPWLAQARAAGVAIESAMTLFFRCCPAPIIGITGTKGKTTTTMLTGAMLAQQHPDTVVAGNLRVSALDLLPQITPRTPVVLELSSFQLLLLGEAGLSPQVAAVTNLFLDHLNYHGTFAAYAEAKRQIFLHQSEQGTLLLPPDLVDTFYRPARGTLHTFSPDPASDATGRFTAEGALLWRDEVIVPPGVIRLPGAHNRANVLAAAGLARSVGLAATTICAAVAGFAGIEHRLEHVRTLADVAYINDTTATNPTAAQVALTSLEGPLVLLAGGADKSLPSEDFAATIVQRAQAVVLLAGSATPRLQAEIAAAAQASPAPPQVCGPYDDLTAAVQAARNLAAPGATVLLSPGCASFGMFHNEFHRGEAFRRVVHALPADPELDSSQEPLA